MNTPPTNDLAIDCRGLYKTYPSRPPVEAVRGVDLQVGYGECFGVLGPNGAGKTTTIEILEGLLPATGGEVHVLGRRWGRDDREIRQRIGVSLQETILSDDLTVAETIRLFRSFYRRALSVDQALASVSLQEKANARVNKLSGGQKQRLAVACAVVSDPQLLFLDEPTTGLDPASRREVWEIIRQLRADGRTILLTTHYMDEAQRLCDRVAIFDQGRVIALGTPDQLIRSLGGDQVVRFSLADPADPQRHLEPTDQYLAALRGLPTVSHVELAGTDVRLTCQQLPLVITSLIDDLRQRGFVLGELSTREATLDDVFIHLTGRRLEGESA
jgi:ABC-2 type transport system ATP-binding protein